jgi:preprotein translocase subunit SecA
MDKLWAEHLAYASYIRESIHLTSLVNRNPINEFHDQIIEAYNQIPIKLQQEIENMLLQLGDSNNPALWEKFGLKSPTSTRTYMINDQYQEDMQNPGSWGAAMVIALWLRKFLRFVLKPVYKL